MIRTQIQLEENQYKRLKKMSTEKGVSMARLIREGVNTILSIENHISPEERQARALSVIGKFQSGKSDIAEKHDEYLAEAYES